MQVSTIIAKGSVGYEQQNSRVTSNFDQFRRKSLSIKNLCMRDRDSFINSSLSSLDMRAKLARPRMRVNTMFGLSVQETRFMTRASSGGDIEGDAIIAESQEKSSGSVLPYVGVACLGAILFGYHLGVVNGALEYLSRDLGITESAVLQGQSKRVSLKILQSSVDPKEFQPNQASRLPQESNRQLTLTISISAEGHRPGSQLLLNFAVGWVVSSTLAGATVGSFTGGSLADKFGRTRTFQLDAIPLAVGAILCATAQSVQTMIIGRLLAGIGIGISSALVPLYISEISPTEIRGALGSVNQLFICVGILAALVAGLPLAANPAWWRTMFAIAVVPSVLLALGMGFSPESPRWLFQQGKAAQAEAAISRLWGKGRVSVVMHDLKAGSQDSTEQEAGWFDLFSRRYRSVVSVGAALFLFQQLAGINAVVYYSTSVFRSAGIASDVAASALVGASNVFGTAVASSLMDKQGRKSLLITSFSGMAASMLLLSLSFTWKALAPYSGPLAVVGTVLYVLSFSLGAGPVPALLLPEIFASRIRAKAVALSLGMHWVSNFVIGLYFLTVVNKFGISSVYLGFAGVCMLAVFYISANVVETKGRSLEEIERALSPSI
ncbi:hypothetical protein GIB67_036428 [Kingdonia uniflora]|uniref:Major facilitator superfamily (MFS) profile domain-containing protein n=1 Tax=Kingdonia uniflora TaxID=39325 RepID=A0A7J7L427_9MAGN|nr:hypothetical protein GIB67_036428 [Kingdonia uniflora]